MINVQSLNVPLKLVFGTLLMLKLSPISKIRLMLTSDLLYMAVLKAYEIYRRFTSKVFLDNPTALYIFGIICPIEFFLNLSALQYHVVGSPSLKLFEGKDYNKDCSFEIRSKYISTALPGLYSSSVTLSYIRPSFRFSNSFCFTVLQASFYILRQIILFYTNISAI